LNLRQYIHTLFAYVVFVEYQHHLSVSFMREYGAHRRKIQRPKLSKLCNLVYCYIYLAKK